MTHMTVDLNFAIEYLVLSCHRFGTPREALHLFMENVNLHLNVNIY